MASPYIDIDHDHDRDCHYPPLTPAETHAVLDAGQAALLRRRADLVDGLRERVRVLEADLFYTRQALDSTCAKLAALRAAMPDPMTLEAIAGTRLADSKLIVKYDQDILFAMAARIAATMGEVVDAGASPHA